MFGFLVCLGISAVAACKATKGVYRDEMRASQAKGLTYGDGNGDTRLTATREKVTHGFVNDHAVLIDRSGIVVHDYTQERLNSRGQRLRENAARLGQTFYRDYDIPGQVNGNYMRRVSDNSLWFIPNKIDRYTKPGDFAYPVIDKGGEHAVVYGTDEYMRRIPGTCRFETVTNETEV